MTHTAISADRVRAILAAYGGAPQRWPQDERDAALALIESDPSLGAEMADARDLDATLALHPEPPVLTINPLAIAAVARAASAPSVNGGARHRRAFWPRAASLAAAAVLGFAIGVTGIGRGPAPLDPEDALAMMIMIEEEAL